MKMSLPFANQPRFRGIPDKDKNKRLEIPQTELCGSRAFLYFNNFA